MNLSRKKTLAAKALKVGAGRIIFPKGNIEDIKEAITKQDMKDLAKSGVIKIKEIKGRKKANGRNGRRGSGKVKKNINKRKKLYVILTRKLRAYISELRKQEKITNEQYKELRKQIRSSLYRSKAHLKEQIMDLKVKI